MALSNSIGQSIPNSGVLKEKPIGFGVVVVINLVEEVNVVGQGQETVSKAARSQELTVVAGGEDVAFSLLVGWGTLPDIHDYIKNGPGNDPDQLRLGRLPPLEVQAPQNAGPARQ